MVAEVSQGAPQVINYTIDRPGSTTAVTDNLMYNPVGTGTPWNSGYLLIGSLDAVNTVTVWLEYEVDLISPRQV